MRGAERGPEGQPGVRTTPSGTIRIVRTNETLSPSTDRAPIQGVTIPIGSRLYAQVTQCTTITNRFLACETPSPHVRAWVEGHLEDTGHAVATYAAEHGLLPEALRDYLKTRARLAIILDQPVPPGNDPAYFRLRAAQWDCRADLYQSLWPFLARYPRLIEMIDETIRHYKSGAEIDRSSARALSPAHHTATLPHPHPYLQVL